LIVFFDQPSAPGAAAPLLAKDAHDGFAAAPSAYNWKMRTTVGACSGFHLVVRALVVHVPDPDVAERDGPEYLAARSLLRLALSRAPTSPTLLAVVDQTRQDDLVLGGLSSCTVIDRPS
jgi:hypothetical protein